MESKELFKILSLYLPYKIKFKWEDYSDYILYSISEDGIVLFEPISEQWIEFDSDELNKVKPILKPLSMLTQEIEHDGERFVPIDYFLNILNSDDPFEPYVYNDGLFESGAFDTYHHVNLLGENTPIWIFKKLIEWKFDVENLIEKGLAIDESTLTVKH